MWVIRYHDVRKCALTAGESAEFFRPPLKQTDKRKNTDSTKTTFQIDDLKKDTKALSGGCTFVKIDTCISPTVVALRAQTLKRLFSKSNGCLNKYKV